MPSTSRRCLAALVLAARATADGDAIHDGACGRPILALAQPGPSAKLVERLRGATVLLALEGQLATAAALIQLDGVAKRIVLWPQEALPTDIAAIMHAADVDVAVTSWPIPAHQGRAATLGAGDFDRMTVPTEWVLFTSGTTGRPKMVLHTLESLAGHLAPAPGAGRVWCTFYDIRRYGGLQILLRALIGGGSLVLSGAGEPPAAFLARAAAAGVTHMLGTPSHWRRALMTEAAGRIAPTYVRLSGEVADQAILDRLRAAYPAATIVHAFASTEAGLAFEVSDGLAGFPAALLERSGAAELRVRDGALQVRSPRNATATLDGRACRLGAADGFVDTGDMVELRDGRYHFVGRRDGVVNVGGQKVHPEEVEEVINEHPNVHMSRVSARRSPITGAIVVAEIVGKPGAPHSPLTLAGPDYLADDIRAFCRARLAPHKVPVSIRLVASLDIAPTGKLVRLSA